MTKGERAARRTKIELLQAEIADEQRRTARARAQLAAAAQRIADLEGADRQARLPMPVKPPPLEVLRGRPLRAEDVGVVRRPVLVLTVNVYEDDDFREVGQRVADFLAWRLGAQPPERPTLTLVDND